MAEILLVFTAAFSKAYDPIFFKIANQEDQIEAQNKLSNYNKKTNNKTNNKKNNM